MSKRSKKTPQRIAVLVTAACLGSGWFYVNSRLAPMPAGQPLYVRFERQDLAKTLQELQEKGVVRDANWLNKYATYTARMREVATGTYRLKPGMSAAEVLKALREPIKQMVRLPEMNWARRNGSLLEKKEVSSSEDYLALVTKPEEFQKTVSFPLPKDTLEGYLYGDTYDFPPLLGAKQVIEKQLKNFEKRVWLGLDQPKDLQRAVIIGSLVELEVKYDNERAMVAGVIENRLKKNMPLQIDAAINYGIQKWRPLALKEYSSIKSPYNLYLHRGLPPTPICNPSAKSIDAALHPAQHEYLYYVALPGGVSLFAKTFDEHKKNVAKRKAAIAALRAEKAAKGGL